MSTCRCSVAISTLGDGCRYCQPQTYIEHLLETLEDARAAPVSEARAQGVVIDPDDLAQFIREIDGNHKMGSGVLAEHIAEHIADSLNTAPVQQVVPDGSTKMQWPEIVALVNGVLGCEAHKYPCERGSIGHEMTGINFNSLARIIDRVRYAAPSAPAADAGCVLEQAMYTLISIGYHENSGLVHELRQALAAHRAKGVV